MDLKARILVAALDVAARVGIDKTTRDAIAARVPCSAGSVSFHYGDGRKLRRAIVEAAIKLENLAVIGWAVAERHAAAGKASEELRARAIRHHLGIK